MTSQTIENQLLEIQDFIKSSNEFLLQYKFGKSFALQTTEIEIELSHNKMLFGFLDAKGFQSWRVKKYEVKSEKLFLELTRNFEKENESVILIPRILAAELSASVELARAEKANKIAAIVKANYSRIKLVRIQLNKENGRLAHIFFEIADKSQTAAITDVSGSLTPEILISTAVLQLAKLQSRKKNPVEKIWILADRKQAQKVQNMHSLLKENWNSKIEVFELSFGEKDVKLKPLEKLKTKSLWRKKVGKIYLPENIQASRSAQEIIKLAPEKIDVIFSKQGETLRFYGLPFARVRRVLAEEKVWFGIEKEKRALSTNTEKEFVELFENLELYRRADSQNKRHLFYNSAPEAWLESLFRRNIKLLDANLILSPVYHQFRAEREKIDLLALRKDGRLVIVELKVAPDREVIFQAADYWRKIELQRRKGSLQAAKIFGDLRIADKPAICYLVAPMLSFHADFKFLSHTISEEVEMHRFNLAENWRENLKVLNREIQTG